MCTVHFLTLLLHFCTILLLKLYWCIWWAACSSRLFQKESIYWLDSLNMLENWQTTLSPDGFISFDARAIWRCDQSCSIQNNIGVISSKFINKFVQKCHCYYTLLDQSIPLVTITSIVSLPTEQLWLWTLTPEFYMWTQKIICIYLWNVGIIWWAHNYHIRHNIYNIVKIILINTDRNILEDSS
jgi:hypothetical protein